MAKMRVHELAKELEIKSQEIIDSLSGTEYEIKSASNNIDDAAQEIIRKKYKKSASKAEEKPAAEKVEKPAAPKRSGGHLKSFCAKRAIAQTCAMALGVVLQDAISRRC